MPRSPKYRSLTIYIKRASKTEAALLTDAEESGTKQLGVLAGIRLAQYYEMKMSGGTFSLQERPEPLAHQDVVSASADIASNANESSEMWP